MPIVQSKEPIFEYLGGLIRIYYRYLDTTNTLDAFRGINNSKYRVYVWCASPDGVKFNNIFEPFTDVTINVPNRYKDFEPGNLSWGAGEAPPATPSPR